MRWYVGQGSLLVLNIMFTDSLGITLMTLHIRDTEAPSRSRPHLIDIEVGLVLDHLNSEN